MLSTSHWILEVGTVKRTQRINEGCHSEIIFGLSLAAEPEFFDFFFLAAYRVPSKYDKLRQKFNDTIES